MDDWTVMEVRKIVDALRLSLEAAAGNAWAVKTISHELKYWMDQERRLTRAGAIRAAPLAGAGQRADRG